MTIELGVSTTEQPIDLVNQVITNTINLESEVTPVQIYLEVLVGSPTGGPAFDPAEILAALEKKQDKELGKGLSANDLTNELRDKWNQLRNYDDTLLAEAIMSLNQALANKVTAELGKGLSDNNLTNELVAAWNALRNYDDSALVSALQSLNDDLANKVTADPLKGLSTNDFTTAEKNTVAALKGLDGPKWRGDFLSIAALPVDGAPGQSANVDLGVGQDVKRYIWDANDNKWVAQSGNVGALTGAQIKQLYEAQPDTNAFRDEDNLKLGNIAVGATKNRTDAELLDRANQTGTQDIGTVTGLGSAAALNVGTAAGDLLAVGAGGWLGVAYEALNVSNFKNPPAGSTFFSSTGGANGPCMYNAGIMIRRFNHLPNRNDTLTLLFDANSSDVFSGGIGVSGGQLPWAKFLTTLNTTVDPNGFVKSASPIIILSDTRFEASGFGDTEAPTAVKTDIGVYEIHGTQGLRSGGRYIETPKNRNGVAYFNVEWEQNIEQPHASVLDPVSGIIVTVRTYEKVWNKDTGQHENGLPMDINAAQDRYISLRFNEIREPELPDH